MQGLHGFDAARASVISPLQPMLEYRPQPYVQNLIPALQTTFIIPSPCTVLGAYPDRPDDVVWGAAAWFSGVTAPVSAC